MILRAKSYLRCWLAVLLLLAPAVWISAEAEAALIPLSFEALTRRSEIVVTAEVTALHTYEATFEKQAFGGEGRCFFTDVKLKVIAVLKGRVTTTELTVQVMGGRLGDDWEHCAEAAQYAKGERVLAFLQRRNGKLRTTGWLQGKYRLKSGAGDTTMVEGKVGLPIAETVTLDAVRALVRVYSPVSTSPSMRNVERRTGAVRTPLRQAGRSN